MDKFTLTITMGNDAMQDEIDVIQALRQVIHKLGDMRTSGEVLDANGNAVGKFQLS